MVHDCLFALSSPHLISTISASTTSAPTISASTTSQTMSQSNPPAPIAPLTPRAFSGSDEFYIIIAISVLVRVIVSAPNKPQK